MPGKMLTKEAFKKNTIKDMQKLGVFKPEYGPLIDDYAELREQYARLTKKYKDGGYEYELETGQGGSKKAPIVGILESLRKDILSFSDRLCLNPRSLEMVTTGVVQVEKAAHNQSKLEKALSKIK